MTPPIDSQTDRIQTLEGLLRQARQEYAVGKPTLTDTAYDALRDELATLSASSPEIMAVGATPVSEWHKVRHDIPMGSLEKVNTPEELSQWRAHFNIESEPLLVTEKLDGISIALDYADGTLARAVTRGDGEVGEDITVNVRRMQGVPAKIGETSGQFRGEIVITKSDLSKHFPDMKNTRNGAAGTAKRLDGEGVEHLTVIVYQIADLPHTTLRQLHMVELAKLGFKTPNWSVHVDPVVEWSLYQQGKRDALDYDIDGLVVEVDDLTKQLSLGEKDGKPHGARAFKFAPPARVSVLRRIQSDTGATGRMTPVGTFDPVDLLGTTVTNASLYNWKYINTLGLDVGASVLVVRANDVIPRVTELVTGVGTVAKPPTECASCGTTPVWEGEYLVCPNVALCPAQALGRLQKYIKELGILEWGEAVLERLLEAGLIRSVPDLYCLTQDQIAGLDRMGEKSAENLLKTLWAKNPLPLETFMGAMSIPDVGSTTMGLVMDAGYDTLERLCAASLTDLQAIKGLGPVKSRSLYDWLQTGSAVVMKAVGNGLKLTNRVKGSLTGISVCFTGKSTMKRGDLEGLVKVHGGTVKSSVGKGLNYLVMADPESGSSKAQAARKLGTKVISEGEFMLLVGA